MATDEHRILNFAAGSNYDVLEVIGTRLDVLLMVLRADVLSQAKAPME